MHDDESDKHEADVGMNRVPDVQDRQRRERARSRKEKSEVHEPARPDASRGVTGSGEFGFRARQRGALA